MKNKVIVFEEISNSTRFFIKWYLTRGFDVFYIRINTFCEETRWIKSYINNRLIHELNDHNLLTAPVGYHVDLAYDNIEKIFEAFNKDTKIVKLMLKLYKDNAILNVFKKILLNHLYRFYYINFVFHKLDYLFPTKKIHFVPTLNKEGYRTSILSGYEYHYFQGLAFKMGAHYYEVKNVTFPLWFNLVSWFNYFFTYIRTQITIIGFICYAVVISIYNLLKQGGLEKKHFRFGTMIISPQHQFANKIQKVDFLIDENCIRKDDVLFISWRKLAKSQRRYFRENKLNFVDDLLNKLSFKICLKIIPYLFSALYYSFISWRRLFILESAQVELVCYAMWSSFINKYHLDNLISYCDFGPQSVCRNIILSQSGTKTWLYSDSTAWGNFYIPKENKIGAFLYSHLLGFIFYDYFVTWSEELIRHFKLHFQNVRGYINVGCLWSTHLKDIREGKIKSELLDILYGHGLKREYKLISIFDATYIKYTFTSYADGIDFLKGIYQLLEEIPNIFILFKEKKSRMIIKKESKQMLHWIEKLEQHPRCYAPLKDMNTSEAMAFSEMTISFPFTSATFEAISARKKAVYYDASNKFRDTFYDRVPGLVCHSYNELFNRTKELLFEIDDFEYNKYLDKYVKGKVESYLDGDALMRFRDLLTSRRQITNLNK